GKHSVRADARSCGQTVRRSVRGRLCGVAPDHTGHDNRGVPALERMPNRDAADGAGDLTFSRWFAETLTRRKLIAWVLAGTFLAAIAVVLLIPPVYRSRASFVANTSSSNKLSSTMAGAAALGG